MVAECARDRRARREPARHRGRTRKAAGLLPLIAAVTLAGAGHARFEAAAARPSPPLATESGTHEMVAVARADATLVGSTARVALTVERLDGVPATGGVRLTLRAPDPPLRAGDRVQFTGVPTHPRAATPEHAAYQRA
ncbi:MAG: DUF4131 domain-containing protein [Dehalococcoidia bacterium]|nr:DUF4131 domain-containing protein [Dehalococcoidia bacterium]